MNAQVHRFGNNVAVYVGNGETVYIAPAVARKIAKALNACARDIGGRKFTDTQFRTVSVELVRAEK